MINPPSKAVETTLQDRYNQEVADALKKLNERIKELETQVKILQEQINQI